MPIGIADFIKIPDPIKIALALGLLAGVSLTLCIPVPSFLANNATLGVIDPNNYCTITSTSPQNTYFFGFSFSNVFTIPISFILSAFINILFETDITIPTWQILMSVWAVAFLLIINWASRVRQPRRLVYNG